MNPSFASSVTVLSGVFLLLACESDPSPHTASSSVDLESTDDEGTSADDSESGEAPLEPGQEVYSLPLAPRTVFGYGPDGEVMIATSFPGGDLVLDVYEGESLETLVHAEGPATLPLLPEYRRNDIDASFAQVGQVTRINDQLELVFGPARADLAEGQLHYHLAQDSPIDTKFFRNESVVAEDGSQILLGGRGAAGTSLAALDPSGAVHWVVEFAPPAQSEPHARAMAAIGAEIWVAGHLDAEPGTGGNEPNPPEGDETAWLGRFDAGSGALIAEQQLDQSTYFVALSPLGEDKACALISDGADQGPSAEVPTLVALSASGDIDWRLPVGFAGSGHADSNVERWSVSGGPQGAGCCASTTVATLSGRFSTALACVGADGELRFSEANEDAEDFYVDVHLDPSGDLFVVRAHIEENPEDMSTQTVLSDLRKIRTPLE